MPQKDRLTNDRLWYVTVTNRGTARTLPVYCANANVARAVARNLPRFFDLVGLGPKSVVRIVPAPSFPDPAWPIWKHVTSNRMLNELARLALSLV